jgi:hypothetical protein
MTNEFKPIQNYRVDYQGEGAAQPWVVHKVNSYGEAYEGRYFRSRPDCFDFVAKLPKETPQTMTQDALDNWND